MGSSLHAVYLSRFMESASTSSVLKNKELLSDMVSNAVAWHEHIMGMDLTDEEFSPLMMATIAHGVAFSLIEHVISNKGIPRNSYATDRFVGPSPDIILQGDEEPVIYELLLTLEENDPLNYDKMGKYPDKETVLRVAARTREWAIREAMVGYRQIRSACSTREDILTYVITSALILHVEGAQTLGESLNRVLKTLG